MARIRSIKPDFWTDEKIVELDFGDRLLFIGLWNFADDQGYLDYRPKRIKMQVFPGDDFDIVAGLRRLHEASLLALYASPEGLIVHITGWDKHQRVSNPARERFQAVDLRECPDFTEAVQSPHEDSRVLGKGREGKGSITPSSADADGDGSADADFPDWYALYPRKVGKQAALKAYRKAHKAAGAQPLLDGLRRQLPALHEKTEQYRPHPATWLNEGRWEDEPSNVRPLRPAEDDQGRLILPPLPKGFFDQ